jgi:hypothetical protein
VAVFPASELRFAVFTGVMAEFVPEHDWLKLVASGLETVSVTAVPELIARFCTPFSVAETVGGSGHSPEIGGRPVLTQIRSSGFRTEFTPGVPVGS